MSRYHRVSPEVRWRVYERAGGRCEDCGSLGDWRGLQLHHVKHKGMGGPGKHRRAEYDSEQNLVLLCARCHSARHGIKETLHA